VWRSDKSRFVATKAPTDSAWFVRFMAGFRMRVGERTQQDAAISIQLMLLLQQLLEEDWIQSSEMGNPNARRTIAEHGAFFLFLYCGSLRGFEGPKILLTELKMQLVNPEQAASRNIPPHVGLPLSGRFKAQTQMQQQILIPIAYETSSGLQPGKWAERVIDCVTQAGVDTRWLFQTECGRQRPMSFFRGKVLRALGAGARTEP
jgi:hypothetical protein